MRKPSQLFRAKERSRYRHGCGNQWPKQSDVGDDRQSRRCGLCRRLLRCEPRRQWPGSRVISAQKANTANAFSLDASSRSNGSGQTAGLALSTANLYSAVQPGGSLYGLQHSNPVDTGVAYAEPSSSYGTASEPMVGRKIGGVNVFGGGLGLYAQGHQIVGGVGVSGDTSCADHNIAWRVRNLLGLDHMAASGSLPAVPGPASLFAGDFTHPDNIIFDITANTNGGTGVSKSGFGHPTCLNTSGSADLHPVVP